VANYSKKYLENLLPHAKIVPAVNQIENHPYLPQQEVVDFCKEKGIHITAYSPLGSSGSPLLTADVVTEIAKERNCSPGAVLLSYHGESTPARIRCLGGHQSFIPPRSSLTPRT
jgi:diketogulonate reductase-like aldo/keto reductase